MLLEAGFQVKSVDLSDQMLAEARKERLKRLEDPGFKDWEIGRGDWLDLENVEKTVKHPPEGYDALICIGNSFAHLPDPTGDQADHKRAISNFHKLLRPGGVLIVDHRNYDYILEHGTIPNTASKLYYQGGDRQGCRNRGVFGVLTPPTFLPLNPPLFGKSVPAQAV